MFPVSAFAQCVKNENCAALGYDSTTACDNGIKCPFGEYWACPEPVKPEGAVLGQCNGYAKNCKIGDILYTDGICSADVVSGKTPIAVVVYIGGDGCGQALALENLGKMVWSTENVNIPELENFWNKAESNYSSCKNTHAVLEYSNEKYKNAASQYYPAFKAVNDYTPSIIPETKGKWCLPAGGVLDSISKNTKIIGTALVKTGKDNFNVSGWLTLWSSTEYTDNTAWAWTLTGELSHGSTFKNSDIYVWPVIEF